MTTIMYPQTRIVDATEQMFGTKVADPYRWLENDARTDAEVAAWVEAQDGVTRSSLSQLPGRGVFRERLAALLNHERLTAPHKHGNRYFFTRNAGLDNQAVLVVREGVNGPDRVLINPNTWSRDGATALAEWSVSENGRYVAFAMQEGGTDWRTIRVLDTRTGELLEDEIRQARFTGIVWMKDGSGFFYSRFPDAAADAASSARVQGHAVFFHALGTPQSSDRHAYSTPEQPDLLNICDITDDGRYAIIYSTNASSGNALAVLDLTQTTWSPRILVKEIDARWTVIGNEGSRFYLTTQNGAERGKVVTADLADAEPEFMDLVKEKPGVLGFAALLGGRLVVSYLVDAKTKVERFRLDGTPDGVLELPGVGTAGGFQGRFSDNEAFFVFTGHNAPTTIWRYAVARNEKTVWAKPTVEIDLDRIVVDQHFYTSKDGTRVPMFIIRRKDVTGTAPTMLYAYGGYGISMLPYYSPPQIAWVEQGGVFAIANIRGGGEYGKVWHDAGRLTNKQNVFDDFIAAGEYLKAEGIAAPDGLAIQGESNGGLLVAAVVNQRPDLFAAALPGAGVLDMLRFHHFTGGSMWMAEYGNPANETDFRNLATYSPYHNIRPGQRYPAVLATTADTDDRVVPAHSFKYIAALQAADLGERPRLLRVDIRTGHGAGKPIDKAIDEIADMWAFAAYWTGLKVETGE